MAAAAAVAIFGGSPEASGHAMALAISNLLGLVCDPVAGLVEIPCVMRNAIGSGTL
ncbi:L-serine dehydratase, alpha subunit [Staphylococcus aureus]|uniref:L-serine ammonia-lyase n=1 Tax=Staphylococcus aureus TaxID=1280 RepID=A0A380DRK7_STAAU|nr:L-serine dehydratase, alpha subunit [Staphylococcus aureus]